MAKTTTEAEIRALVAKGMKFPEIARDLDIKYSRLIQACSVLGIRSPKRVVRADAFLAGIKAGLTLDEIGAKHGVTRQCVYITLKRAGAPTCAREYLRGQVAEAA